MSSLQATITKIDNVEQLNIVYFDFEGVALKMMSLDLPEKIAIGSNVLLSAKPSHIAIAKNLSGVVSYSNQIRCIVDEIELGKLLCSIKLKTNGTILESIITVDSIKKMDLKIGDEVVALIKASELSIMKVIDD